MAQTVTNPKVGQMVYHAYSPKDAGYIVEVLDDPKGVISPRVRVQWLNGDLSITSVLSVRDLDALIAETAKKLKTHKATRLRVIGMKG